MNIKLSTLNDIHKWNKIVDRDPHGIFFDRLDWCHSLSLISHEIRPLPLFLEENGKIISVFPLCFIKKIFGKHMESLPYTEYGGGPLLRNKDMLESPDLFIELFNSLTEFGIKNDCVNLTIRRAVFPDLINENITNKQIISDDNTCNFIIPLNNGINKIYNNIKKSRRTSIKEGMNRGLKLKSLKDEYEVKVYYDIYDNTMKRLGNAPLPICFFEHIWKKFSPRNEIKIFLAEYKNKIVAGILLFIYKKTCYWWGNVSLQEYWDKRPTDFLLWNAIEWATSNDLDFFDLGTTINDPSSGHYFYKSTWGGKKIILYNYNILLQPNKWKFLKFGYNYFKKIKW